MKIVHAESSHIFHTHFLYEWHLYINLVLWFQLMNQKRYIIIHQIPCFIHISLLSPCPFSVPWSHSTYHIRFSCHVSFRLLLAERVSHGFLVFDNLDSSEEYWSALSLVSSVLWHMRIILCVCVGWGACVSAYTQCLGGCVWVLLYFLVL